MRYFFKKCCNLVENRKVLILITCQGFVTVTGADSQMVNGRENIKRNIYFIQLFYF